MQFEGCERYEMMFVAAKRSGRHCSRNSRIAIGR